MSSPWTTAVAPALAPGCHTLHSLQSVPPTAARGHCEHPSQATWLPLLWIPPHLKKKPKSFPKAPKPGRATLPSPGPPSSPSLSLPLPLLQPHWPYCCSCLRAFALAVSSAWNVLPLGWPVTVAQAQTSSSLTPALPFLLHPSSLMEVIPPASPHNITSLRPRDQGLWFPQGRHSASRPSRHLASQAAERMPDKRGLLLVSVCAHVR